MVTVKVQVLVLPLSSVAELVTVVTPTGKVLPLGGELTMLLSPQLAAAVTSKVTLLRLHRPGSAANTRLFGQSITGFCVLVTVTLKVQVLVLPLASVATFVTVVVPTGNVLPLGRLLTRFVTLQLSVALTLNVTLVRLQRPGSAVSTKLVGHTMTGFCVSVMVTVKVQVLWLPLASRAVFVTIVTPTGKVLPLGGVLTRLVTLQLSVALTANVTLLRLQRPKSALNTKLAGHVIVGFCVSSTVTVKVQLLELPLASVAVLVTVVTPTGKVLPLGGALIRLVTLQLSVALTLKVTLARLQKPGSAARTRLAGQVIVGF
jgi:hypothetical protein